MSQFTDWAENKLADMVRGQAWSLGASLYIGLASAASDSTSTELSGTGYARVGLTRNLTNWLSTQGDTSASTGTTHSSSNAVVVNFGTSGSAWGTANYVEIWDAASGGNRIAYLPMSPAIVIGSSQAVSLAIGIVAFTLGLAGGCTDYLANKLVDFIWRGQAFTFPATMYSALFTAAPSNAGGGTEVGGGVGYARPAFVGSLANWSGTQAAGTTVASTGTGGLISNNVAIPFAGPVSGPWGALGWDGWFDAATTGNLLFWAPLAATKTVSSGATPPPSYQIAARTITFA